MILITTKTLELHIRFVFATKTITSIFKRKKAAFPNLFHTLEELYSSLLFILARNIE